MATVSGVPVENITSISSVDATSIQYIAGVATANIPGWPGAGPSCTTRFFGYSDGRRQPPSDACIAPPQPYDQDPASGDLYVNGGCGVTYADAGYYSDGFTIYFWGGFTGSWVIVQPCDR